MQRIYLDNNATAPIDSRVRQAMVHELEQLPSNPSAVHGFGREARGRLTQARKEIADFFAAKPSEILFTSGGTEALNMLIRSGAQGHILSSDVEHSAAFKALKATGKEVTFLPVGLWGAVKPEAIAAAMRPDTRLIVLTAVNSETGVKTDIPAIAEIAKRANIPFIVDGVAWLGKEAFTLPTGVSAIAFSAHKFHGPQGVGFALIRPSFKVTPLLVGGDQEYGRRAGTENLPGIMGMAKAIELLSTELPAATKHMEKLRDDLEETLRHRFPSLIINGQSPRICNTSNITLPGLDGEGLLQKLDLQGIAVSHGSACASGALEPSRVLLNMGLSKQEAASSLRISLSRMTTLPEIEALLKSICA